MIMRENVVEKETVDTAVSVTEKVEEIKGEGDDRGGDEWGLSLEIGSIPSRFSGIGPPNIVRDFFGHYEKSLHQFTKILRLWSGKVNSFDIRCERFADVDLLAGFTSPIAICVTRIDDGLLQFHERLLCQESSMPRLFKQGQ
ncbi:MAG: hypothetical protein R3F31_21470 [Verrucomicrobiales bacterium]